MAGSSTTNNAGCMIPMGGLFALFGIVFGVAAFLKPPPDSHQLHMQAFAALAVSIIGIGLIAAGRSAIGTAKRTEALATGAPDKPWLWREDWAQGYAKPDWQSEAATRGAAGLLVLLVSSASAVGALRHPPAGQRYIVLLVLVLPLGGLFLVGQSILIRLREAKFRSVRLAFSKPSGCDRRTFPRARGIGVSVSGRQSGQLDAELRSILRYRLQ